MNIKKTMTDKALAANKANAEKSTGPHDSTKSSRNAIKHGLLSSHLHFTSEEHRQQFQELIEELDRDYEPDSAVERMLVEEVATCFAKLGRAGGWAEQELAKRREGAEAFLKQVRENDDGRKMLLFDSRWSNTPAQLGWDLEQLVVQNGTRGIERQQTNTSRDTTADQVQIEARLTSSLDTTLRYQAAIKRDLYKALATLHEIQKQRK